MALLFSFVINYFIYHLPIVETVNKEITNLVRESFFLSNDSAIEHYGLDSDLSNDNSQSMLQPEQLLFIDSAVENYQGLIDNLAESASAEVIILDSQQDGIVQISEHLNGYDNLSSIHIVSHGDAGQIFLGNAELDKETLSQYTDLLTGWNDSLEADGDIVLYGCDVAADLAGKSFIKDLSQYTQADILASTDITGNSDLGGDWELEYAIGNVEAESIFDTEIEANYQHVLNGNGFGGGAGGVIGADLGAGFGRGIPNVLTFPGSTAAIDTLPSFAVRTPILEFRNGTFMPILNSNDSFSSISDFKDATRSNSPASNSFRLGFTTESLNFTPNNFNFSSVSMAGDKITFGFEPGTIDFSRISDHNNIKFLFQDSNGNGLEFKKKKIDLGALSFNAETVTFTPDTVSFEFDTNSMNVNLSTFRSNANLYEYKLLESSEFNIEAFNASDYRAAQYAFGGDGLFDGEFYSGQTVVPEGMNPFTDYVENGFQAGMDPSPLFDVDYYLETNVDIRDAQIEPFRHYMTTGFSEINASVELPRNPNPLFNNQYYLDTNPDVRINGMNTLRHYVFHGDGENSASRDPSPLFDNSFYNENNPDLEGDGITALEQYLFTGGFQDSKQRDPNEIFDSSYYNQQNPDVVIAGIVPLVHYVQYGWRESYRENPENFNPNRNPNPFFNTADYFEIHEDVRIDSFINDNANPVQHMLEYGFSESRITSKVFQFENIARVEQEITADSEYFPIAQKEFRKLGSDLRAKDDGTIEISQGMFDGVFEPVEKLAWYIIGGIAVTAINTGEFIGDLADDIIWEVAFNAFGDETQISGFTASPDIPTGTPPFEFPESTRTVEIFVPTEIQGTENIFFTPLDDFVLPNDPALPDDRDIVQELIDGSIFTGGETIPQGTYAYPSQIENFRDVYNPEDFQFSESLTFEQGGLQDVMRGKEIRALFAEGNLTARRTRQQISAGFGNVGFADYDIQGRTGTIKAISGSKQVQSEEFAPFVPPEERNITSFVAEEFNRAVDAESKILEQIFNEVVDLEQLEMGEGTVGTIRLVTDLPACKGCGKSIQDFIKKTKGRIEVELVEIQ